MLLNEMSLNCVRFCSVRKVKKSKAWSLSVFGY
jgi:hypothetical protein